MEVVMALPRSHNVVEVSEATKKRYLKNLAEQMSNLRRAMEKSDYGTVREICHRVRGSASLFGLKDLGEACRDTEEACLENRPERVVEGFQVIEVIVSRNSNHDHD
jgi:HPt (histidine-containing phosphotransfer) domain-containing protein